MLAEVVSIFNVETDLLIGILIIGMLLGIDGDIIFAVAVVTMRDSWRAGIAEEDNWEMIMSGIYKISRNPAFLGFVCVYFYIFILFFDWNLLFFRCLRLSRCICR